VNDPEELRLGEDGDPWARMYEYWENEFRICRNPDALERLELGLDITDEDVL
jgi:hypothetical protein